MVWDTLAVFVLLTEASVLDSLELLTSASSPVLVTLVLEPEEDPKDCFYFLISLGLDAGCECVFVGQLFFSGNSDNMVHRKAAVKTAAVVIANRVIMKYFWS